MRRSRLSVVEANTKRGIEEYLKSSKSRREVRLPLHVPAVLERCIHRLERDAVAATATAEGRVSSLLDTLAAAGPEALAVIRSGSHPCVPERL
ncbi:hypothetical protein AB0C61_33965 [Streptomyces sp. NPDC048680]|uniref:hypothetical protein n=1 Tax=Streptomyces sp. NPDC048680 TaxID=3155492 RepID=UPI003439AB46